MWSSTCSARFEVAHGAGHGGRFVPLTPERAIDTREPAAAGTNAYTETGAAPVNVVSTKLGGAHGLPLSGVGSVVLTVTALAGADTRGGWVTVTPGSAARPEISNVNTNAAEDIRPNLVVVPLGADGSIDLHLFQTDDVVVDVTGYFTDGSCRVVHRRSVPVDRSVSRGRHAHAVRLHPLHRAGQPNAGPGGRAQQRRRPGPQPDPREQRRPPAS